MTDLTYERFEKLIDDLYHVDHGCGCCAPPEQETKAEIRETLQRHLGLSVETVVVTG